MSRAATRRTTPPMTWCLGCNYPLRGLTDSRCPECGRMFDLSDNTTFNASRPLTWLDRQLLAPIGLVTFALILVPLGWLLWMSLGTDIYYMGGYLMLMFLVCGCVAVIVGIRVGLKKAVPPLAAPRSPDRMRIKAIFSIALVTCVFVLFQVPLRVAFLFARPELNRMVADIQNGRLPQPVGPRRAWPLTVATSGAYGGHDTLFFRYSILGMDGGLAYCPTNGPAGYYNTGNDGPLGWHWHWWVDD